MSMKREREIEILKTAAARLDDTRSGAPVQLAREYQAECGLDEHDTRLLAQFIARRRTPPSER